MRRSSRSGGPATLRSTRTLHLHKAYDVSVRLLVERLVSNPSAAKDAGKRRREVQSKPQAENS